MKTNWVLHNYLRDHNLGHFIPRSFLPVNTVNDGYNDVSTDQFLNTPVESRGERNNIEHESEVEQNPYMNNIEHESEVEQNPYIRAADRDKTKDT